MFTLRAGGVKAFTAGLHPGGSYSLAWLGNVAPAWVWRWKVLGCLFP